MTSTLWGPLSLGAGEEVEYTLGRLRLRIRRRVDEVWMHAAHDDDTSPPEPGVRRFESWRVDDVAPSAWIRWAVPGEHALALEPTLPDRPVVVSPEQPFFLPPEGRARVFVRVPVSVRICQIVGDQRVTLEEFPSVVLSDTWWGTFTDGELGYWLGTHARRLIDPSLYVPHLAICPFVLANGSEQALPVERFAVRVAYLTLFGRGSAVWTDEVHVRYRSAPEGSEIRYTGRRPADAGEADLLAESREQAPRGLHARTFGRLRAKMAAL